ncbi:MAG TPA: acetyl-CoA synthetase, partial [Firmicutes bacterium]|nr:acetyl-CoA synthetase [Bacillota bacterium]
HIVTAKYMQCVQNNGLHLTQSDSGWAKFGWGNIYGQWICGSAILGYDPVRFDPHSLLEVMEQYKPTSLCIPPTMYRFLLHNGLGKKHIESIQWFSTAGEPLSGEVNKEFYNISGQYIHEGFGQSEGTPITCEFPWIPVRPSSMGKPSPLYHVALIHPDGTHCRIGEEGEIVIITEGKNQIGLLLAYYTNGALTRPDPDGIYHTGDIAYEDEDGYYWYAGRNDDMIKCSGYRIGPFEIESVLNTHPAVRESAIIGYPDEIRGQIVCAAIKLREGYNPSDELTKELQIFVKTNTAPYKYPRKIFYLPELPKTTSGKIIRKNLRAIITAPIGMIPSEA